MRGFTSLAQTIAADAVIRLLNRFLGAMIDIISAHGGVVDQIMGDGLLATFGALNAQDDDALRAAARAIDMQNAMPAVNAVNIAEGLPSIGMGIAVNGGSVIVGNIGSTSRMKYSVIGSAVNIVSRIQSLCLAGQILLSDATWREAGPGLTAAGSMRVKLRSVEGGLTVHDLVGVGGKYNRTLEA